MITHRLFTINGQRVNIPSYILKPGDVVGVHESATRSGGIREARDRVMKRSLPIWLQFNTNAMEGRVVAIPTLNEMKEAGDIAHIRETAHHRVLFAVGGRH